MFRRIKRQLKPSEEPLKCCPSESSLSLGLGSPTHQTLFEFEEGRQDSVLLRFDTVERKTP